MRILLLVISIFFGLSSSSRDKPAFYFTVINNNNGLNTNNVTDLVRDDRGFLWIATNIGITRYASHGSIHFTNDPESQRAIGGIAKMFLKDSIIYFGGISGLYKVNTHNCRVSKINLGKADNVLDIIFYNNQIIVSTLDGRLIFYNTIDFTFNTIKIAYKQIVNLVIRGDELFCLSLDIGCLKIDLKTKKILSISRLSPFFFTDKLHKSWNGDLLFTSKSYLKKYDFNLNQFIKKSDRLSNLTDYLELDTLTKIYIVNFQKIIFERDNADKFMILPPVDPNTELKSLKSDLNGDIYIISNQGLIIVRRVNSFQSINPFNDNDFHVRRAIVEDTLRKRILFFSYDKYSSFNQFTRKASPKNLLTYAHAILPMGDSLLIATEGSTIHNLTLSNLIAKRLFIKENPALQFISFCKYNNQGYFLGTMQGLYFLSASFTEIKKVNLQFNGAQFNNLQVKAIWVKNNQEIWVGGSFGILVLNAEYKVVRQYSTYSKGFFNLPNDEVNCFYSTSEGVYTGLDGELSFIPFDDSGVKNLYSPIFGKSTNRIVCILEDNYHDIWFSTYQGIYRYDIKTSAIRAFHAPLYFSNDEFNRSSSLKASNGKLYFGNIAEYIEINPEEYHENIQKPQFHFNTIRVFGNENSESINYDTRSGDTVTLPHEGSSIDISFSLNDAVNSEQFKYQYRLMDLNNEWISLGSVPSLRLFSLPAGDYHLQIRAIGDNGYLSDIINLTLIVPAFFFNTIWFTILIVFVVTVLAVFIYFIRVNNLKKMLLFRKEISNELHDNVGTSVTKSIYAAQSIMNETGMNDKRLQQIIDYGRQINSNFRDVLWSLEQNTDQIVNLFDRIREIGNAAVENSRFEFTLLKHDVSDEYPLSVRQKRELLMISREAFHNALKHSNGNIIIFEFSSLHGKLHLHIRDNGSNQDEHIQFKGMGLESIKQRIKKMGGKVTFFKGVDGFVIHLEI